MAVDPSLTCSGWALFNVERERLAAVGKIKAQSAARPMAIRLRELQARIADCLEDLQLGPGDVLVCEAPTTMRDPRAALVVEQVRGLFETLARARSVLVPGRVNPRTVHHEVMGLAGKQLPRTEVKSIAVQIVGNLYAPQLKAMKFSTSPSDLKRNQDIVDAILLGNVALARLRSAKLSRMTVEEIFDVMIKKPRARLRKNSGLIKRRECV